jgi:hypothetical protein
MSLMHSANAHVELDEAVVGILESLGVPITKVKPHGVPHVYSGVPITKVKPHGVPHVYSGRTTVNLPIFIGM